MASKIRQKKDKTEKVLRAVRPSAALQDEYYRKIMRLVRAMNDSVVYWLKASYRKQEDRIVAYDESPAEALRRTMKELADQWLKKFDQAAENMAEWFAQSAEKRSTDQLKKILRDGGISVPFEMTSGMRDVMDATVNANVSLIRSIPRKYLSEVEDMVQRSVQTGRDIGQLSSDLQKRFGITKRRANFIATDQNEKATAAFNRVRMIEAGIDEAQWVHSGGGKDKRKSHVKASKDKVRYKISKGWFDPEVNEYIQPGYLPRCKCVAKAVIRGFS